MILGVRVLESVLPLCSFSAFYFLHLLHLLDFTWKNVSGEMFFKKCFRNSLAIEEGNCLSRVEDSKGREVC